jgi:hypothetical protein
VPGHVKYLHHGPIVTGSHAYKLTGFDAAHYIRKAVKIVALHHDLI